MKDILEVIFKFVAIITLPAYIIGYGIYGIRVWAWNIVHRSAFAGDFAFRIPPNKEEE